MALMRPDYHSTRRARRQAMAATGGGFTLIELLVVLVVIGLLAGSAVVALEGRQERRQFETQVQDLAAAIRFAAEQARATGSVHRVVIAEQQFRVERESGAISGFEPARGAAGRERPVARGMSIEVTGRNSPDEPGSPRRVLNFGDEERAFDGTVSVSHEEGGRGRIDVAAVSGQVHVSYER